MSTKRTEPSARLFDPSRSFKYTNAVSTDLAKKFKAIKAAKSHAERAEAKGKRVAIDPRQTTLELPVPDGIQKVISLPKRGAM